MSTIKSGFFYCYVIGGVKFRLSSGEVPVATKNDHSKIFTCEIDVILFEWLYLRQY